MKYRKKPVVIDAVKWTGKFEDVAGFVPRDKFKTDNNKLIIITLEGQHIATTGDFIIRGVQGEFYPCKPDIFEQTYERVEE